MKSSAYFAFQIDLFPKKAGLGSTWETLMSDEWLNSLYAGGPGKHTTVPFV